MDLGDLEQDGLDWDDLRCLIDAAGSGEPALTAVVRRLGPGRVASVLVRELSERIDEHDLAGREPVTVRFDLAFDRSVVSSSMQCGPAGAEESARPHPDPQVTVEQDLTDLTRGVYGPDAVRRNPTRRLVWHDQTPISSWSEVPHTAPVVQCLLRGSAPQRAGLAELMLRHGSDKWGLHFYPEHYDRYLGGLRDSPVVVLEIGIGGFHVPDVGGGSLRAWSRYFHRGLVCGVDIESKTTVPGQRIRTRCGDQADAEFLHSVVREIGALDVIIDDGSHRSDDVIATFGTLFPLLRPGGHYVIEDLQTSYWPRFGGSSTDLTSARTSMGFLKLLVDGLNHEEIGPSSGRPPTGTDTQISGVHFHHNLAVVTKGRNEEGSLPRWHPARAE
ncbi:MULTISPECIES: hypothetical protein [Micromonospora]|uniref:hypothetical protein n=1 Tax=Micromonospora TaxID=1873 RepID=UPI0033D0E104